MINYIRLVNWMSHKDTRIEFKSGKILIYGKNGAGKTSIMEGILFGLFGDVKNSYRSINKSDYKSYIRDGQNQALIEIEFKIDGKIIRIVRELYTKKPMKSKMEVNGVLKTSNHDEIIKDVEKLLGIDKEIFTNVFYGAQDNIYKIMELAPKELKSYLDNIFGINDQQEKIDKLDKIIRYLKKEIDNAFELDEDKYILEQEIKNLEKDIYEKNEEKKRVEKELEEINKNLEELKKQQPEMENKYNLGKKLNNEKLKLEESVKYLYKNIQELEKELSKIDEKLKELYDKEIIIEELKAELDRLKVEEANIKENKIKYEKILREIEDYKDKLRDFEIEINNINNQLDNISKKTAEISSNITQLENKLSKSITREKLIKIGLIIVILFSILFGVWVGVVLGLLGLGFVLKSSETNNIKQEIQKLKIDKEGLDREYFELSNSLKQKTTDKYQVETQINNLEKAKENYNIDDTAIFNNIKIIEQLLQYLDRKKEIIDKLNKLKEELNEKLNNLNQLNINLKEIGDYEDEYKKWMEKYNKYKSLVKPKQEIISKIKAFIETQNHQLKKKKTELEEILELINIREQDRKLHKELTEIRDKLNKYQISLRSYFINELNIGAEKYWNELYGGNRYGAPRIFIDKDKGGYMLNILTYEGEAEADRLSGGEKTLYALAIRLAIMDLVSKKLRVMILDEPTHNLDNISIENLINNINKLSMEHIDQFIVITHDDLLKNGINWTQQISLDREKTRDSSINYTILRGL